MENQIFTDLTSTPKRPSSLTTLCILSFIMTGVCAIFCLLTIVGLLFQSRPVLGTHTTFIMDAMPIINCLVIFLANFISLAAVIMMWKLKKSGYLLYILAETIPWITSVLTLKVTLYQFSNPFIASLGTVFMIIFDVVFIFLYSRHLKYMK